MANDVQIDKLSIEVGADAGNAAAELDAVTAALDRLAKTGRLTRIQNNLNGLRNQLKGFESINSSIAAIERLKTTLNGLSGIQNAKGLSSTVNVLKRFPEIAAQLQGVNFDGFRENVASLSAAFEHLGTVDKASGLASTVNALKKIPDITSQLNPETIREFGVAAQGVRDAIQPLATEIDKLGTGFSRLPTNIQKVITANQKLVNSSNSVTGSVKKQGAGLLSTLGKLTVFGFSIRAVARYIGQSLNNFNEYVENVNLFSVSMGEYTQQAAEFAQRMQDVLGVDAGEAMRNMGLIQNLTTSFGMASDKAYILSKNITQLGYDFASFYNISSEEAFTKLQAAISGELEPIRRLGIDISTARLQQELFNLGIEANVNELNQADKSMLRYIAIMKQSTNAQTDMARTLNSPANMMRVFNAQVQLLARSIGSLFIPMLNAVLPPLIAFIQVVREAISAIAAFFGVEVKFADVTSSVAPSLGGVSDDIGDIGSSAAKSAKEIRMLIGGFDELNVLPEKTSPSGGGGGGGGGSLLGDIPLPEYDMFDGLAKSKVAEYVDKIKKAFKKLMNVLNPILPLIKGVMAALASAAVLKSMANLWEKLKTLKGVSAIGEALKTFWNAFKNGDGIIASAKSGIEAFRAALGPVGIAITTVASTIGAFVTAFDAAYKVTKGTLTQWQGLGNILASVAIFGTIAAAAAGPVGFLAVLLGTLAGAIAGNTIAQNELDHAYLESALYNNGGVKLQYLTDGFLHLTDGYNEAANAALQNKAAWEESNQALSDASLSIYDMVVALESGYGNAEELVPMIAEKFDFLQSEIENNMELIRLSLTGAFIALPAEIVEQLGLNVDQLVDVTNRGTAAITGLDENLLSEAKSALEAYQQTGDVTKLYEARDAFLHVGGAVGDAVSGYEAYKAGFENLPVDFTSLEEASRQFDLVSSSADSTAASLNEAKTYLLDQINTLPDELAETKAYLSGAVTESYDLMIQSTYDEANRYYESVKEALGGQTSSAVSEAFENEKPSLLDYLNGFSSWIVDTNGGTLEEHIRGWQWTRISDNFKSELGGSLEQAQANLAESEAQFGLDFNQGIANGITDNVDLVYDEIEALETGMIKATHDGPLQFKCPSQKMYEFGVDTDQGLANGITDKISVAVDAMNEMGRQLSNAMGNIISDLQRQASQANIVINVVTEYSTRGTPAAGVSAPRGRTISNMVPFGNVPALAGGGVLYKPRLVLAGEYANARSNPEIIAPQSMMRETVSEANEQSNREEIRVLQQILVALQQEQKIDVDGYELFRLMREHERRDAMRTGSAYL